MGVPQNTDRIATFEWTEQGAPSTAVVMAVADESGIDPVTLDPLYETVDPDSLDAIFAPSTAPHGDSVTVRFEYHGYGVIVQADGRGYLYK